MIAYTASYYGISPLIVEQWKLNQINDWFNAAVDLESEKNKAYKKALEESGQKS
jgi:hypothetical protein